MKIYCIKFISNERIKYMNYYTKRSERDRNYYRSLRDNEQRQTMKSIKSIDFEEKIKKEG